MADIFGKKNVSISNQPQALMQRLCDTVVAEEIARIVSWKVLLAELSWRRRLLLGCGVQAFGQLSGIDVMDYHGLLESAVRFPPFTLRLACGFSMGLAELLLATNQS
jgi:hypothetical protein